MVISCLFDDLTDDSANNMNKEKGENQDKVYIALYITFWVIYKVNNMVSSLLNVVKEQIDITSALWDGWKREQRTSCITVQRLYIQ